MAANERSAQIWTVLIFAAYHRQTVSYEILGRLLGVPSDEVAPLLEPVRRYCIQQKLPPLTSIVVGVGGASAAQGTAADIQAAQSSVFHHPWLSEDAVGLDDMAVSDRSRQR